ncbi:MAG TPA: hypothetical protein VE993_09335 [Stellaceae bacterium]|nr:hypothetical protein [Stellaceae bacterium]
MMRWQISLVLIGLLAAPLGARAQNYPTTQYPTARYPTTQYPTSQYPSTHYPSSPPAGPRISPAEAAAQRQSGLTGDQVRTLLRGKGYTRLNSVEADPNSVWVWQADATRDGRKVRVGVDYRGNVLVISPTANQPCTSPGVNLGVGGLGVGARLSTASSCASR